MSKTLNLYTSDADLRDIRGNAGLLFECASDSAFLPNAELWFAPGEMLGSADESLHRAYSLVAKLLKSTPVLEGCPLLAIFEESLLEQCSYLVRAQHLDGWIAFKSFTACRFTAYSPWLDRLRQVQALTGSTYKVEADIPPLRSGRFARTFAKLWNSRRSPSEMFRRVMPLFSRHLSASRQRRARRGAPQGGAWFYSTSYNYTRIALAYEPYLPQALNFLVEDPATGGKRLAELGRQSHELYAWSALSDIPSRRSVTAIAREITDAIHREQLDESESTLRTLLLRSEWFAHFVSRLLPLAIFQNRVLRRWRQSVAPDLIMVGNAGWERALLMQQSEKPVPMVMLQHGIMHWVYSVADQPVDTFLLRGAFFQRVLNERLRSRTVVCNFPEGSTVSRQPQRSGKDILFITAPYHVLPLFHASELPEILKSLLLVSYRTRRRLVIRVHPMEEVATYRELVATLQAQLQTSVEVIYSQGAGAEESLANSCVAVLFFSTMFLDCLRHGIPMVSFGWHWFPYEEQFEREQVFNFARDLQGLEDLVQQGVDRRLPVRSGGLEDFLAPANPEDIASLIRRLSSSRGQVASSRS